MRIFIGKALIPRALEHWRRDIGIRNRIEIQALQHIKRGMNLLGMRNSGNVLEDRILELQGMPLSDNKLQRDLIKISHFLENLATQLYGKMNETEVFETIIDVFKKSEDYAATILLLSDDGSRLRIADSSLTVAKSLKWLERKVGVKLREFTIDLKNSQIFRRVVEERRTFQYRTADNIEELFPKPLASLISSTLGYEREKAVLTPILRHGKLIGALAMTAPELSDLFIPFVESLGQRITIALERADEFAEQKRLKEELQKSEIKFRTIFEFANDEIVYLDKNGVIIDVNDRIFGIFGWRPGEAKGKKFEEFNFFTKKDLRKMQQMFVAAVRGGETKLREVRARRKDGGTVFVEANTRAIRRDDKIEGIVVIVRDVTGRKRAEKEKAAAERRLKAQQIKAMEADRLAILGEMAAGMAHELNQPLVGIRGVAEHIAIGLDKGWEFTAEDIRKKSQMIIDQADRMSRIIEHIRLFAREAGKPETQRVKVNDVVRSTMALLAEQLRAHGLEIKLELDNALPQVMANPFSLEEVIINLLTNARHAIEGLLKQDPSSESRILLRTRVKGEGPGTKVEIEVTDSGVGIPPDILKKVFNPFYTTKEPKEGTGLGLSICKGIIDDHEGAIRIQSKPGRGTTVTVSLPAAPPDEKDS